MRFTQRYRRRFSRFALLAVVAALASSLLGVAPSSAESPKDKKTKHDKVQKGPVDFPDNPPAPQRMPEDLPSPDPQPSAAVAEPAPPPDSVDLKVLVLAADGTEAGLPAIKQALEYLGTPYDVFLSAPVPADPAANRFADPASGAPQLAEGDLATSTRGRYSGIILTTGSLGYASGADFLSGLTDPEWRFLWAYEARFGVRQLAWYVFPTADLGFQPFEQAVDTGVTPLSVPFTEAGKGVFGSYANTATPVPITNAYTYLAKPLTDGATVPLLSDRAGYALAAVRSYPDGRENLSLTFDSNAFLLHNLVLSYGLVNWVTKGLFLGERHVYLSAQVDDLLIENTIWTESTPCGTSVDDPSMPTYRTSGGDVEKIRSWQDAERLRPVSKNLRLTMAYNGYGSTTAYYDDFRAENPGAPASDTLTPAVRAGQSQFNWVSHTYTHENLDAIGYDEARSELQNNQTVAERLALTKYATASLVQPDVSGLANPEFLRAASDFGIRQVVSDTSRGGTNTNPSPNAGVNNAIQPNILQIPRRPNNLYFNVSTPEQWLAEDNCIYPTGANGHVDTYDQLLDRESNVLLTYLLRGDIDPWMFHQANLRAYDGTNSLLGDLLDRTLTKYSSHFTAPVISPTMDELAGLMTRRMQYNASGASGNARMGSSGLSALTLTSQGPVTIPVTGVGGSAAERYAGQDITYVTLKGAGSTTLAPSAALSTTRVTFGTFKVGTTSSPVAVTLSNTGPVPLQIKSIGTIGDYAQTNDCGTSLAAGARCTIKIVFKPTRAGTRYGGVVITDNADPGYRGVLLTGTGKDKGKDKG